MPELPEVESVRRSLERRVRGLTVSSIRINRREVVVAPGDPEGGFSRSKSRAEPVRFSRSLLLRGARVDQVLRRGKQLAIVGVGGAPAVGVHLGMTGQVLYLPPGAEPESSAHVHVVWRLRDPSGRDAGRMLFRDPRRFGGVWAYPSLEALRTARWDALGPDALGVTGDELARALARTKRAVKAALLDQAVVAGVGNIYADEALFRAGIDPRRPGSRLSSKRAERLAGFVREVLSEAVEAGGSTLRDYRDADGNAGMQQVAHQVYGRAGRPCASCGRVLSSGVIGQRTTVWCGSCQR